MSEDQRGWPDPARPGYPLNPERDGWHWLRWDTVRGQDPCGARAFRWERGAWIDGAVRREPALQQSWTYKGPCLTPAEVAAREAAAAEAMRGGCSAAVHEALHEHLSMEERDRVRPEVLGVIDNIPLPAPGALDRVLEAERAKMQAEEQALARIIVAADLMEQATALGPDWAATMQLGLDRLGLSDALARMLAAERRAGMENAVGIADAVMQQAATCAREPDLIPNIRREYLAQSRGAEDVRDAIRARMEESNGNGTGT